MKNSSKNITTSGHKSSGFIEIIVVIIVALVGLHLLGIDLTDILSKQWVKDFAIYVRDLLILVWNDIKEIIAFIKGL
ncbi:MAG: hypothetical protein V4664_01225 [Patescibacteria group bacterium]